MFPLLKSYTNFINTLNNYIFYTTIIYDSYSMTLNINTKNFATVMFYFQKHTILNCKLIEICPIDLYINMNRFNIYYTLVSEKYNFLVQLLCQISEIKPHISISNIYAAAMWLEREAWDLFGISFLNHADLRRIFTDYGFIGFPLRKDFPITGYIEYQYQKSNDIIRSKAVTLSQDIRIFNYNIPWKKN